jgi:signal peptidase I
MNDDQSMRDLVADGHGSGEQATEIGPQPDGQARPGQEPAAGETAQDQAAQDGAGPDQAGPDQAGTDGATAEPGAEPDADSEEPDKSDKGGATPARRRPFWRELVVLVVLAMTIALLIKTFVVQAFFIPSSSMETTLLIGDKVLVNKLVYHLRPIKAGDIVVFDGAGSWVRAVPPAKASSDPIVRAYDDTLLPLFRSIAGLFGTAPGQTDFIKRVIGTPGDRVACCTTQGLVTVNGVPLHEKSYLYPGAAPSDIKFSVKVPPGRLWVMGDNRQVSDDSRLHSTDPGDGTIPENMVIGRAFMIVWPIQRWRILPIPATFNQAGVDKPAAAADAAADQGIPVRATPAAPYLPLAGGFVAALPLTWLQRRARVRVSRRRAQRQR